MANDVVCSSTILRRPNWLCELSHQGVSTRQHHLHPRQQQPQQPKLEFASAANQSQSSDEPKGKHRPVCAPIDWPRRAICMLQLATRCLPRPQREQRELVCDVTLTLVTCLCASSRFFGRKFAAATRKVRWPNDSASAISAVSRRLASVWHANDPRLAAPC